MKDDSEDFSGPYLPARYKEVVRKKRQRRLLKKIGITAAVVIALAAIALLLSGFLSASPHPAAPPLPSPSPAPTVPETPVAATPSATPATTAPTAGTPAPAAATSLPAGTAAPATGLPETIQTAMASTYRNMTPSSPAITEPQARAIALTAFPGMPAGNLSSDLETNPGFGQVWNFTLRSGTAAGASGLIDADTGTVVLFSRPIPAGGRPADPVLTLDDARRIADSTIDSRNSGILSINMSSAGYVPLAVPGGAVAGSYRFVYNRIVQDYPCDADGFIVSVDAVSGAVTEYVQRWQTPDNSFMVTEDVLVPKHDAEFTVLARAKSLYPATDPGIRILSAGICWKDRHDPASVPRLSSIPLAWKIVFDDNVIQARGDSDPGVAWVDVRTGEIIDFTYRH